MRLLRFEHFKPSSLEEALTAMQESAGNVRVLAGGTDLLVNMKCGLEQPGLIVSIGSLPELNTIAEDPSGDLRIGAGMNLSELAENSLLAAKAPALRDAIKSIASQHIRNMATLGGNVCLDTRCWYYNQSKLWRASRPACYKTGGDQCHATRGSERCHAINSADTAPALIALGAQVVVQKKGSQRQIPAEDFYRDHGARHTVLEPDELLSGLVIPCGNETGKTHFLKISRRQGIDFALGSIAAHLAGNGSTCHSARLVIGSLGSAPIVLEKTAQVLVEAGLSQESIQAAAEAARSELGVLTTLFSSAGYKRDLAQVLVKRVLHSFIKKPTTQKRTRR